MTLSSYETEAFNGIAHIGQDFPTLVEATIDNTLAQKKIVEQNDESLRLQATRNAALTTQNLIGYLNLLQQYPEIISPDPSEIIALHDEIRRRINI